jgi:site-specific recombinase XerD
MEKMPALNYQSFLAEAMRDYLDYLDHLGFSNVGPAYDLRRIDRFLVERHIGSLEQCDSRLLAQMVDQYRSQVKANTLRRWRQTFHGLCRYLVYQGWMRENPVTAFPFPKPEPYRPYVFSTQELGRFFDCLQQPASHSAHPLTAYRLRSRYTFYHLLYAAGCAFQKPSGSPPLITRSSTVPCLSSPRSSAKIA